MGLFTRRKVRPEDGVISVAGRLTAFRVLKCAYDRLRKDALETVRFEKPVDEVIGADGDPHRGTRYGYLTYDEALILRFGGKVWAVALGRRTGTYPGGRIVSGLSAVSVSGVAPDELLEAVRERLADGLNRRLLDASGSVEYLHNTLAFANSSEGLKGAHGWFSRFGPRFEREIGPALEDLGCETYGRALVDRLVDYVRRALSET